MNTVKIENTLTGNPNLVVSNFDNPPQNPLKLLELWLYEADRLGVSEPKGLVLSTVNTSNQPSSRVVLLKEVDDIGIIFASCGTSQKGKDLSLNPFAAGTLWWRETIQQINLQGFVVKLSEEISQEIFKERTRNAQAIAAVSQQSSPMNDEMALRTKQLQLINQKDFISKPDDWHAYHLTIQSIEFWHGSEDRFHKRLRYDRVNNTWQHQKLQP